MLDIKNYLIHFEPPQRISDQIQKMYATISNNFENKYNSIVDGIWRSHLMVYLSPMPVSNQENILQVVKDISKTLTPFQIELGNIVKGTSGYIFIEIDELAQTQLEEIRNKLIERLMPLRDSYIKQKYLERWDELSKIEQERIRTTGLPYEYKAHFTIAQVPEGSQEEAIATIKENTVAGEKFTANKLQVITFENGINTVIGKFPLLFGPTRK